MVKNIIKGVIISIVLTLILLIIFSFILANTNFKEQYMNTVIIIISALSILIGAGISTIKIKKNGMINGLSVASIYMLIIYIISSIFNSNYALTKDGFIMICSGIILGVIGGIIGANIKL